MVRDQVYPNFCSSVGSTLYFRFLGQAVKPCSTDLRDRGQVEREETFLWFVLIGAQYVIGSNRGAGSILTGRSSYAIR